MSDKELKEILIRQFMLLRERSNCCKPDELCNLTNQMIALYNVLQNDDNVDY